MSALERYAQFRLWTEFYLPVGFFVVVVVAALVAAAIKDWKASRARPSPKEDETP